MGVAPVTHKKEHPSRGVIVGTVDEKGVFAIATNGKQSTHVSPGPTFESSFIALKRQCVG